MFGEGAQPRCHDSFLSCSFQEALQHGSPLHSPTAPTASPSAATALGAPREPSVASARAKCQGQSPTCSRVGFVSSAAASFLSKVHGQGGCGLCQRAL